MALKTILLTTLAMIAFAANSVLARLALLDDSIDALSFTAVRLLAAAAFLLVLCARSLPRLQRQHWDLLSVLSLFGYALTFSLAYRSLPTAMGALLLFGAVQFTMIGAGLLGGERPRGRAWLGILLALAGFGALLAPGLQSPPWAAAMLMAASGICWGVYSLRGRHSSQTSLERTMTNFTGTLPLVLLAVGGVSVAGGALHGSSEGLALAVVSGAITSGAGYAIWYAALRGLSATQGGIVQLSVPVIAAAGGLLFAAEVPSATFSAVALTVLAGIALVLWPARAADVEPQSASTQPPALPNEPRSITLFDAVSPDLDWRTANDTVMGGCSSSTVARLANGHLRFTGELSLDSNGGFVSMRCAPQAWDLSETRALRFAIRGDGRSYSIRVQADGWREGVFYNGAFDTQPGQWELLRIDYADMVPRRRGRVQDLAPLNPGAIISIGLLCTEKQPGPVAIEIAWIEAAP